MHDRLNIDRRQSILDTNEEFAVDSNNEFWRISIFTFPPIQEYCTFHDYIYISNGVSLKRGINRLFNNSTFNFNNTFERKISTLKVELRNFLWGVYIPPFHNIDLRTGGGRLGGAHQWRFATKKNRIYNNKVMIIWKLKSQIIQEFSHWQRGYCVWCI